MQHLSIWQRLKILEKGISKGNSGALSGEPVNDVGNYVCHQEAQEVC